MKSDEFGEVDIDLLADYIGGALDGPGAAEVARLIDEDPQWRAAHDRLVPGMAAVGAELGALASAEPMPADLAARLETSFASASRIDPPSERHLTAVPGTGVDAPARKRKRLRWAAPIAVAAGVLAFAGFGVDYLVQQGPSSQDAATSAGGSAENAAPMIGTDSGAARPPEPQQIMSSGTDYRSSQLSDAAAAKGPARDNTSESAAPLRAGGSGQADLVRLRARDALLACLEAISRENGQGPIVVETVDYARYQGMPALVVRFVANGVGQAWAVGPDCGADGAGAGRL